MLVPMPPTDALFLLAESREHPMHVGGLQLFVPPDGAEAIDIRRMFEAEVAKDEVSPLFRKRARRRVRTRRQWARTDDRMSDRERHVRRSALPQPGRTRGLLA